MITKKRAQGYLNKYGNDLLKAKQVREELQVKFDEDKYNVYSQDNKMIINYIKNVLSALENIVAERDVSAAQATLNNSQGFIQGFMLQRLYNDPFVYKMSLEDSINKPGFQDKVIELTNMLQNLKEFYDDIKTQLEHPYDKYRFWVHQKAANFFGNTTVEIAFSPATFLWNQEQYCTLIVLGLTGILEVALLATIVLAVAAAFVAAIIYPVALAIAWAGDTIESTLIDPDDEYLEPSFVV
jgi:hypothetical protein